MNQASNNAADSLGYSLYGYLNQGYFSKDSLLCTTQAHSSSFGMSGTLVPYSLRSDNAISAILLVCFCLIVILGTHSHGLFTRQLKMLFRAPRENSDSVRETSGEVNVMITFVVISSLLLGISANLYITEVFNPHFLIGTNAIIVLILSALFLFYFFAKWFFQSQVNLVFFGGKRNIQFITVKDMSKDLFFNVGFCGNDFNIGNARKFTNERGIARNKFYVIGNDV